MKKLYKDTMLYLSMKVRISFQLGGVCYERYVRGMERCCSSLTLHRIFMGLPDLGPTRL